MRKISTKYLAYVVLAIAISGYFWINYFFYFSPNVNVHSSNHPGLCVRKDYFDSNTVTERWLQHQVDNIKLFPPVTELHAGKLDEWGPFSRDAKAVIWDVYPPQVSCPRLERIGRFGDGGKWVCDVDWLQEKTVKYGKKCIMYSYGISTDSTFETAMYRRSHCEIHAFDPTIGKLPLLPNDKNIPMQFHKSALAAKSGSSSTFLHQENILDTMHRLNHSYIDILKVDVEGNEWEVFLQLFQDRLGSLRMVPSQVAHTLPFGQLLIELHYMNISTTHLFFSGMEKLGFYVFSREFNLDPCLYGNLPQASEYSFINPHSYYEHNIREKFMVPLPISFSYHHKINAVIYYLTQKRRVSMMGDALMSLYKNVYKHFPFYSVLVFHDDLDGLDEQQLQKQVPHMQLTFIYYPLETPSFMKDKHIPDRTKCSPLSSTIGYRHMIRFHSTLIHQYLSGAYNGDKRYQDTEYILRLDDDSSFNDPVGYDLFRLLKDNNMKYGFVNTLQDDPDCVDTLWNVTREFIEKTPYKHMIGKDNMEYFDQWREGRVVYNNFEISHVSLWRHPLWLDYMRHIDLHGGIYTLRWGDAPLHTIALLLIIPLAQIHAFLDVAYVHEPFVSQVSRGLPKHTKNPFRYQECVFYDKWICSLNEANITNSSVIGYYADSAKENHKNVHTPLTPIWGKPDTSYVQSISSLAHAGEDSTPRLVEDKTRTSKTSKGGRVVAKEYIPTPDSFQKGVLFTFGHILWKKELLDTLKSFYINYLRMFPYPVVVFHASNFDKKSIQDIQRSVSSLSSLYPSSSPNKKEEIFRIQFVEIDLLQDYKLNLMESLISRFDEKASACGGRNAEARSASLFLIHDAFIKLHEMGYDWFFRFADDSRISSPIVYDIFRRIIQKKKNYAFKNIMRIRPACVMGLDSLVSSVIAKNESNDFLPANIAIATDFEISHFSMWNNNSLFHKIMKRIEKAYHALQAMLLDDVVAQSRIDEMRSLDVIQPVFWDSSTIHTAIVRSMLEEAECELLKDVDYKFVLHSTPSEKEFQNRSLGKPLHSITYLDQIFRPQRLGWLGGDVASSFMLPSPKCLGGVDDKGVSTGLSTCLLREQSMYVWLFGDSIVGTSSSQRRIEGQMIHNTVGLAQVDPLHHKINNINYFWRYDVESYPAEIFQLNDGIYKNKEIMEHIQLPDSSNSTIFFWPNFGLSSLSVSDNVVGVKAFVVGSIVEAVVSSQSHLAQQFQSALSFTVVAYIALVVDNPYDAPSTWTYHPVALSPEDAESCGRIRWISVANANGLSYTIEDEYVYILASFNQHSFRQSQAFNHDIMEISGDDYDQVICRTTSRSIVNGDVDRLEISVNNAISGKKEWMLVKEVLEQNIAPNIIFSSTITEGSLHYDDATSQWTVVSSVFHSGYVKICVSKLVDGPWSCKDSLRPGVHTADANEQSKAFATYAARAHPELSPLREGTVISMVSNTLNGPHELFYDGNLDIYTPHFCLLER